MAIKVYGFKFSSFCRSVLMTAKHLNIKVELVVTDPGQNQQFTSEFLALNPAHSLPTIDDNGFILWESRAIMAYLCNEYGGADCPLYPRDPQKRALIDRWLNFDATLMESSKAGFKQKLYTGVDPPADKVLAFKGHLKLMDQLIANNRYLTGANHVTIADLSLVSNLGNLVNADKDRTGIDMAEYPNIGRWYSGLTQELPYFQEINAIPQEERKTWVANSMGYLSKRCK
ncbi:unnamed protein product [Oppiella nova]|uniref:Glutathione S-transferase n=1 Tax=Oppiella nova TaxID=334625 RepID=A0A7R9QWI5_9ACAR|nr:unnamed protein product [Oppiella nova]CAG2176953.1 unnamed protein product [Oppiella nova]